MADPDERDAELAAERWRDAVTEAEERAAERRWSSIEAGRRKGGLAGAATAGIMLALRDIYEPTPPRDDIEEVFEASGDPGDIDRDGIAGTIGDVDYWAPPPN